MSATDPAAAHADEIAAFLAAPPPRVVPAGLRRAALRQGAPIIVAVLGGVFVLMGGLFTVLFVPWNFFRDRELAAADTATATGRVVSTARTSLSINKIRVVSYEFEFRVSPGAPVRGVCYTTGERWRAGNAVTVRYRSENPARCCIAGARLSKSEWGGAFVLLFPLTGAGMIVGVVVVRRRTLALLERGFLAEALVASVEQTNVRINNRYVHKITLQRTDSSDSGVFTVRSSQPEVIAFANERMATNQPVYVLYDPAHPKRAMLPESL